jgi:NAD(P)-dependent dehydrogenase (short-subunit alcohol dehydrogenase family)
MRRYPSADETEQTARRDASRMATPHRHRTWGRRTGDQHDGIVTRDPAQLAIYPSLRDRVVIVTGGASGIGEAIVWRLAHAGARVGFVDLQDEAAAALIGRITSAGMRAPIYRHCDVIDIAALTAALDNLLHVLGPAAALVNNVGNDDREPFDAVTPQSFDHVMHVNLRHVFFASRIVAAQMRELGFGSIINMSSGVWIPGLPDLQGYSAAKSAILGLTNSLARQLGPDNIRVNAIAPGAVLTARQRRLWMTPENLAGVLAQQCLKTGMEPEDIAEAVLFLAADESRMVTKQCFYVNAGLR